MTPMVTGLHIRKAEISSGERKDESKGILEEARQLRGGKAASYSD